jgi:hypothetical protein
MHMIGRIAKLVAILALLTGALAVGLTVSAANTNPNGAQVVNINQCEPDPFITGGQFCITEKAVLQNVYGDPNAGGNTSVTVNGHACITETDSTGAVVYQSCQNNVHEHILVTKDGTTQESHLTFTETETSPYGTFCETVDIHTANGQVQYSNVSFTC